MNVNEEKLRTIEKSIATYTNQRSASQEALLDFSTVTSMKQENHELIVDMLESHIDFLNKQALFVSVVNDDQHNETISLLNRLYNGTNKTRKLKEERFIEQTIGNVNRFLGLIVEYKNNPIPENEKAIRDELSIEKECLGFKYWIIKDDSVLLQVLSAPSLC